MLNDPNKPPVVVNKNLDVIQQGKKRKEKKKCEQLTNHTMSFRL